MIVLVSRGCAFFGRATLRGIGINPDGGSTESRPADADDVLRLFQFKCAAIERHHFSNAADFELANICAVT